MGHLGDILMMTLAIKELSMKYKIDLQFLKEYNDISLNLVFINKIFNEKDHFSLDDYDIFLI